MVQRKRPNGQRVPAFEEIKPGTRLKGLDASGVAEVVSVSHFGPNALNLVFRGDGKVAERLVTSTCEVRS
jgi:hypothetical protein